jgi:LysM repeat protein
MEDGDVANEDGLLYLQRKRKTGANEMHTVAPGETLYQIAQAEGIRLESLLGYNYLTANARVQAGEKLYLKEKAPAAPKLATGKTVAATVVNRMTTTAETTTEQLFITHTVQPKETVYSIARKYETSVDDVKKWNEMDGTDLKIGQQIRINKTR